MSVSPTSFQPAQAAQQIRDEDLQHIVAELNTEFSAMQGSRLLITGGAGFLGYYLVQTVLAANDLIDGKPIQLMVMDNFMRGLPEWLGSLEDRPDLTVVQHNISDPLPAMLGDFQYVVHAAGIASPAIYRAHPIETMDANVNGLRRLLDRAVSGRSSAVVGFLFFSSSEIYGDPASDAIPTPETYRGLVSCTGPRACYDESKRYGETLCVNFHRVHGVPVTSVRPFNNYGPGMKITDGRVIADFCQAVIEDRDIVMFSDGSPTRTFCYVADAITGYYKALVAGRRGEVYNIGVENPEISMADLAELVVEVGREVLDYGGSVIKRSSPEGEYLVDNPNRRCPRIGKAREELGYRPVYSLREGIRRTLTWYRHNRWGAEE